MPRRIATSTMLRVIPNAVLQPWFSSHVPGEFDIPWDGLAERDIDQMLDHINDLLPSERNGVEIELQAIRAFACESGMSAIEDAAKSLGDRTLMSRIPTELNLYGRAMWVRLNEPDTFSASSMFLELDGLAYFRKRNDLPAVEKQFASNAKERLSEAISNLLKEQGRGQYCTVETLTRGSVEYFAVHPDDFVRCEQTHDDNGVLSTLAIRPTLQIAFAYDRQAGSLEMSAALPKSTKEELERIFAACVLGWDLGPFDPDQAYHLDHLKDSNFDLATDPSDNVRARIEEMKLFNRTTSRPLTVVVRKNDPEDNIHRAIEEEVRTQSDSLWHYHVRSVAIRFDFPAARYRRAGHQTIRIIAPRSCNLLNASPERVELIQKYLKLWNIDCATNDEQSLVAVGA